MYFLKVTNESFLNIIEEGWASAFLPGAKIISDANVKQLASNPKFRKYVKAECQKIERELKKEHPNIVKDYYRGGNDKVIAARNPVIELAKRKYELGLKTNLKNSGSVLIRVDGYICHAIGDTNHIETVVVTFLDVKEKKYYNKQIPAPSKGFLKDDFFRNED